MTATMGQTIDDLLRLLEDLNVACDLAGEAASEYAEAHRDEKAGLRGEMGEALGTILGKVPDLERLRTRIAPSA